MTTAEDATTAEQPISRHRVVKRLLTLFEEPTYLEVGVSRGVTFHHVTASHQVAVDPAFLFDVENEAAQRPHAEYHSVTSDDYFGRVSGDRRFNVIYLDGLHTLEQTLRDLLNALDHLEPRGVIVIDDVRPPSYHASLPDQRRAVQLRALVGAEQDKSWMGDVYRLVWFIDTFCQGLTYRTIADNHGQLVVWRQSRADVVERSLREVAELSFEDFALEPDVLRLQPFREIMRELKNRPATTAQI